MSRNPLVLIIAVLALLGGGAYFSGIMNQTGGLGAGRPALELAALTPEKQAQATRGVARMHEADKRTVERALEAQKAIFKEIGANQVQRRKLCIGGLIESEAPLESVDPAAGLASELTSECSVVVGWLEKIGGLLGGDPTAEKLQRVGNLWRKYFIDPKALASRLSVEVETAVLEMRARRHGYVSGLGGRGWSDLQSKLKGGAATLLGEVAPYAPAELAQLRKAGKTPEDAFKSQKAGRIAQDIVAAAFEEAASTMGLELELVKAAEGEKREEGAALWVAAFSRAVLAAAPQKNDEAAAAKLEGAVREALAVAIRDAEAAMRRRLTEKLEAQQAAELAALKRPAPVEGAPDNEPVY